ncbi:MAG TPA: arsenic resistance N-acetyltransferase ArsN2 [Rhodocyclaceae bacterium]
MDFDIHPVPLSGRVRALLHRNQLPTSDIEAGDAVLLFSSVREQHLAGVVGLQVFGRLALLRSLAVSESERGRGLGGALVRYAEKHAASLGVRSLYLLTTSADQFFAAQGYSRISRADSPAVIAATAQFSGLCPSSSAFMVKVLRP